MYMYIAFLKSVPIVCRMCLQDIKVQIWNQNWYKSAIKNKNGERSAVMKANKDIESDYKTSIFTTKSILDVRNNHDKWTKNIQISISMIVIKTNHDFTCCCVALFCYLLSEEFANKNWLSQHNPPLTLWNIVNRSLDSVHLNSTRERKELLRTNRGIQKYIRNWEILRLFSHNLMMEYDKSNYKQVVVVDWNCYDFEFAFLTTLIHISWVFIKTSSSETWPNFTYWTTSFGTNEIENGCCLNFRGLSNVDCWDKWWSKRIVFGRNSSIMNCQYFGINSK